MNLEFPVDLMTTDCEHGKLKIRDVTPAVRRGLPPEGPAVVPRLRDEGGRPRHPHRRRGCRLHRSRSLSPMPITHSESGTATHPGAIGRASVEAEGPDGWQSPATPTHPDAVGRASVEAEGPDGWQSPGAPPARYAVCCPTAPRSIRHFIEGTAEGHDPLSALVFLKSSFPHSFTIRHSCSRSGSRYTAMAIAKRCADLLSARAGLRDLSLARIPASQGALIKAAIVRGPEPVGFYHIIKLSRMHVLSRSAPFLPCLPCVPWLKGPSAAARSVVPRPRDRLSHTPNPSPLAPAVVPRLRGGRASCPTPSTGPTPTTGVGALIL